VLLLSLALYQQAAAILVNDDTSDTSDVNDTDNTTQEFIPPPFPTKTILVVLGVSCIFSALLQIRRCRQQCLKDAALVDTIARQTLYSNTLSTAEEPGEMDLHGVASEGDFIEFIPAHLDRDSERSLETLPKNWEGDRDQGRVIAEQSSDLVQYPQRAAQLEKASTTPQIRRIPPRLG